MLVLLDNLKQAYRLFNLYRTKKLSYASVRFT